MKAIWKYELVIADNQSILMPEYAVVLAANAQDEKPVIWVEVDPGTPLKLRHIEIFGTGHPIDNSNRFYIGTVFIGNFVWHVYEKYEL